MPKQKKNTRAFGQRKKKVFFRFFRFLRGKGMQKQKKTRVRSGREKKKRKKTIFRPRRERKKTIFRPGTERKKENFSIFPVFCGEKVCRKKSATHAFGQRKKKRKFFDFLFFPALSAKGVHPYKNNTAYPAQHHCDPDLLAVEDGFMSSACQVAIEHGETSATNILLKSVEFIFLIVIMMNLSWWTYHLLYLLHLEISRLSCETPESQKGRCQLPPPQMCVIEHDSCSKPQTHGKPNWETQRHWAIISGFWMILVVSW